MINGSHGDGAAGSGDSVDDDDGSNDRGGDDDDDEDDRFSDDVANGGTVAHGDVAADIDD